MRDSSIVEGEQLRLAVRNLTSDPGKSVRIEMCGGVGVGKSTVAQVLATNWDLSLASEPYQNVPFWKEYYDDPNEYELEKNVSFVIAYGDVIRSRQRLTRPENPLICDFALIQALAFSDLSSSRADANAVEALYERIVERFNHPRIIIHVRCTPRTQLKRIENRGRAQEAGLEAQFLRSLNLAIEKRVRNLPQSVGVITVDTDVLDFVSNAEFATRYVARKIFAQDRGLGTVNGGVT